MIHLARSRSYICSHIIITIIIQRCFLCHWTFRFKAPCTPRWRNLNTEVSLWKRIKCLRKARSGKSHNNHDTSAFVFKLFLVHTNEKSRRFQIPPVWRAFSNPFSWQISVDGRPNRGKKSCIFKFLRRSVDATLVTTAEHKKNWSRKLKISHLHYRGSWFPRHFVSERFNECKDPIEN